MFIEDYEIVVGLEVHAQLATQSKIFSGASATFGGNPNSHVDSVTMGLPGCLPVPNKKVIESAIKLGLALNCQIRNYNRFARKHYFYPDLPKGYQISQFEEPICEHGHLNITVDDMVRNIGITRIHMEEDAGKNIHDSRTNASLVDLNRAGVPLLEIVSEPDLRSPEEASVYLRGIRQIIRFLGIGDGNMEEGSLRCDANISLRPRGSLKFGTRTEIKNINSFKFVEKAIFYEATRQLKILKEGGVIIQETRLFDSATETTRSMRGKEGAADYRYFPDPDLPPLHIEESWIQEIRSKLPILPHQKKVELVESYGLTDYDASLITSERENLEFYEEVYSACKNAKLACNWMTSELFGFLNKNGKHLKDSPVSAKNLGQLIKLIDQGILSGRMAKDVFEEMFETSKTPEAIIEEKGLKQVSDPKEIINIIQKVISECPDQVRDYLAGKEQVFGFLVGQVMKNSGGKANPKLANEALKSELQKLME